MGGGKIGNFLRGTLFSEPPQNREDIYVYISWLTNYTKEIRAGLHNVGFRV
jgi:hypothetical protein